MDDDPDYDIEELESMLYSKIHHEEISEDKHQSTPSDETTIASKPNKNRYWNQSGQGSLGLNSNSNTINTNVKAKTFNKKLKYQFKKKVNETRNDSNIPENNKKVTVSPFLLKPFEPYKPIMENSNTPSAEPTESNSNYTKDGDSTTTNQLSNIKDNITIRNGIVTMKNVKRRKKTQFGEGPFKESFKKLEKLKKFQSKKSKAAKSRNSTKKYNANNQQIHTISLSSSAESESEDVIEIKLPPPPLVTIDDSSDEENDELNSSNNSFAKPKDINLQSNKKQQDSSRCTTPCSIISDDFIGQTDRTTLLLSENQMNANDDDLNFTPITVSNFIENSRQCQKIEPCQMNLSPINTTKQKNQKKSEKTDFRVSKENIVGAIDVYESESDLTESVYSKGSSSAKKQKEIILSSSDSDNDIIESLPKSKRFRKRRASSTNKDSEPNNGDSSSDTDMDKKKSTASLSFVSKGEAIERYKNVLLPRKKNTNQDNSNCSDTEFLSKLNSIVQGRNSDMDSHSSDNENTITARTIAEDVLSTLSNAGEIESTESDVNNTNENVEMEVEDNLETSEDFEAIPNVQSPHLMELFDEIDNLFPSEQKPSTSGVSCNNSSIPPCNNLTELDDNLFRDPPLPPSLNRKKKTSAKLAPKSDKKKIEKKNEAAKAAESDSSFYVVESNVDNHVGWTEEQTKFYENSWGGENFNVNKIKGTLDRNARWTIYSEDRFPKYTKRSSLKCNNCSRFGHVQSRCPEPKKPIVCYMCGNTGHKEPRCPNTICLRCGNKTRMFTKMCNACAHQNKQTCSLCKIRGHSYEFCTDRWRRYHSTTSPSHKLNDNIVYNKVKFCCVCAKRGHLSQDCKSVYRFSEYPLTSTDIKSHAISYKENENVINSNSSSNIIKYNLLYQPDDSILFDFSYNMNINENKFYARFLKATNLKLPPKTSKYTYPLRSQTNVARMNRQSSIACSTITRPNVETVTKPVKSDSENEDTNEDATIPENEDEPENEEEPEKEDVPEGEGIPENEEAPENESSAKGAPEEENTVEDEGTHEAMPENEDLPEDADTREEQGITKEAATSEGAAAPEDQNMPENESDNIAPPEKSSALSLQNHTVNNEQNVQDDEFKVDSDSNYSFSEHFNIKNKPTQTDERKTSESFTNDSLPEFISLNDNPSNDNDMDIAEFENGITQFAISSQFQLPDDDENERDFQLPDIPCVAKILLKRHFSEYLLSAEGNKYLIESSSRNNVRASIDWSSFGNLLIIEGLPIDQDNFHSELLVTFQSVVDKTFRKQCDDGLRVPKKRVALIRLLSNDIMYLKQKIGDASVLLRKLRICENQNSNKGFKTADKIRKSLNMILYGQAGLKDGKNNLDILTECLKNLQSDTYENVENDLRERINISWKYIFSSQRNGNYEELVEMYCDLKRNNALQNLEIDPLLFRKRQLPQDQIGNGPNQANNVRKPNNFVQPAVKKANNNYNNHNNNYNNHNNNYNNNNNHNNNSSNNSNNNSNNNNQLNNQKSSKLTLNSNTPVAKLTKDSFEIFLKENQKIFEKSEKLNGHSSESNVAKGEANKVSQFWSQQAIKYINDCREKFNGYNQITEKLEVVLNNANQGLLSYNDYRSLIQLQKFIK